MQVKKLKRNRAARVIQTASALATVIERLEERRLFTATLTTGRGPVLATPSNPSADTINLSQEFTDTEFLDDQTVTGTVVQFKTTEGDIDIQLTDSFTPNTVANFLSYVNSGAYANTFFHRSVVLSTNAGGTPSAPSDIVQGGGYKLVKNKAVHIPTNTAVDDEFSGELEGDVAGTLAMAKTSQADSATSEFFFNVHDNTSALDTPTVDSNGVSTSYTVFGVVLGNGVNVVDNLAALPTSSVGKSLTTVPITGVSAADAKKALIYASNLVYIQSVSIIPSLTYSVVSDNPQLVNPVVKGSSLSFQYAAGKSGVANITVTATSIDGTTATETFPITVPNTATPAASVVATPYSQTITSATATTLTPLTNVADSQSPINPGTVTIFAQPAHGTANVNTSNGTITYVPTAGYSGADTLQYTVADYAGHVSTATTISLTDSIGIQVTVGTGGDSELDYTQPDGATAHLTVSDGSAVVTFADDQVNVTTNDKVARAIGAGATISSITITDTTGKEATLHMSGTKVATIGSITAVGTLKSIDAPNAQLTGQLSVGGLGDLTLGSTDQALLTIGGALPATNILISTATDTSIAATSALTIRSKQWLNSDGLDDTITAASINKLNVSGNFTNDLNLTSEGVDIASAAIGGALSGTWTTEGSVTKLSAKSAATTWSLTSPAAVGDLTFAGNLDGSISGLTIGKLNVGGAMSGSTITSTAAVPNGLEIYRINVQGAVADSSIIAGGDIGDVHAASLTGSQIYAGVTSSVSTGKTLASPTTDFPESSFITSIQLGKSFSNSLISASILKGLHLGKIQTSNGGSVEGVAGVTIDSITGALSSGGNLLLGKAQLKTATTLSTFLTKKKITLGDFEIEVD